MIRPDARRRAALVVLRDAHDPALQPHTYDRCALCSYTRHPCDVHELTDELLGLYDRLHTAPDELST